MPVIPAILIYAYLAHQLNFIQDDAYISYRYVANFLNGDGLVYNIGQRIEGFTNFGWVVYLILLGRLGIDFLLFSQITGFILGGGFIILAFLTAREVFDERERYFALLPAYLVGVNVSLAYWSPAGLETAAFAFMAALSFYLYLRRSRALAASLALAVWIRPEGAVVAGILIVVEAILKRGIPRYTLLSSLLALVSSLPLVAFKIFYYGSVFPNPFFAKTGWHVEHLSSGLEYAGRFMAHYGFYGIGFILPLVFFRKLPAAARAAWLFTVLYCLYVILIGGDVLKVHRFFIPVFGTAAILASVSLWHLACKLRARTRMLVLLVVSLPLLVLTYVLPKSFVRQYNRLEIFFTKKMTTQSSLLKASDSTNFSVAIATIGRFGYELLGHDIIDLVGLTDSTIARHSEEPIPGMETTWKERKHNSGYLLRRAPDYIMFSTGIKPSAPAERALLLYPEFLRSYRAVGWISPMNPGVTLYAFKRVRDVTGDFRPTYPVAYVENFKAGLDAYGRRDHRKALEYFNRALQISPQPYNLYLLYGKAFSHMVLQQHDIARPILHYLLEQDSLVFEAHRDLYLYALYDGKPEEAALHLRWLEKLIPWDVEKIKADFARRVLEGRSGQQP